MTSSSRPLRVLVKSIWLENINKNKYKMVDSVSYKVYQGFRFNRGKSTVPSEIIIFGSLLTTFIVSNKSKPP